MDCSTSSPTPRPRASSATGRRGRWSCGGSPRPAPGSPTTGPTSAQPGPSGTHSPQPGRLQQPIAGATPPEPAAPTELSAQLRDVAAALRSLVKVAVPDLERMLRATIDASSHRIDPWLAAIPQRRLDALQQTGQ